MIGLVTGFQPFAGLPTNPAELVLDHVAGSTVEGIDIVAKAMPVSRGRVPGLVAELVAHYRPAFVLSLGVALGSPLVRVEKVAINAADFGVADVDGARPAGERFSAAAGNARFATWDATGVAEALLDAGIPARISYHAGTHLCNLTLFSFLEALEAAGLDAPCGFLHLPYLPEQIVWMMRHRSGDAGLAPGLNFDQPSMALAMQVEAVRAALGALARQSIAR